MRSGLSSVRTPIVRSYEPLRHNGLRGTSPRSASRGISCGIILVTCRSP